MTNYHVHLAGKQRKREKKSVSRQWGQRRQADTLREYDNQALDLLSHMTSKLVTLLSIPRK